MYLHVLHLFTYIFTYTCNYYIQIDTPWSERSESVGHVPAHLNTYTYTDLHNIQIDTLWSERSEGSERSELVGHAPVHTKFMCFNSNNIQLLPYA